MKTLWEMTKPCVAFSLAFNLVSYSVHQNMFTDDHYIVLLLLKSMSLFCLSMQLEQIIWRSSVGLRANRVLRTDRPH